MTRPRGTQDALCAARERAEWARLDMEEGLSGKMTPEAWRQLAVVSGLGFIIIVTACAASWILRPAPDREAAALTPEYVVMETRR